jgi:hypothetical protein
MFVQYVGVLKDILKLDYGRVQSPIIIFWCVWMKWKDNWGNPTYVRDDVGFLTINFWHRLLMTFEPFIFPSQVMQIFFFDDLKKLGWKVILREEAHSKKEVANLEDVFISTIVEQGGLSAPIGLSPPPSTPSLIRTI